MRLDFLYYPSKPTTGQRPCVTSPPAARTPIFLKFEASLATPVDATVIYYGNVNVGADKLRALAGPVLGHFATRDDWINEEMVRGFAHAMAQAGKGDRLSVHWYDADHAFANPTSSRYDAPDAAASWARTTAFLSTQMK